MPEYMAEMFWAGTRSAKLSNMKSCLGFMKSSVTFKVSIRN